MYTHIHIKLVNVRLSPADGAEVLSSNFRQWKTTRDFLCYKHDIQNFQLAAFLKLRNWRSLPHNDGELFVNGMLSTKVFSLVSMR